MDDCNDIVAAILGVSDTAASRRLVLDAWACPDRALALRVVLAGVREYAAHARTLAGTDRTGGEVRGVKARPPGAVCWWLGRADTKACKPAMGFCEGGKPLPKEARWWCVEGQGLWYRLPGAV